MIPKVFSKYSCVSTTLSMLRSRKLACHLAERAVLAGPRDRAAQRCVIEVFTASADREISLMGRGLLTHAVRKAEKALAALDGGG